MNLIIRIGEIYQVRYILSLQALRSILNHFPSQKDDKLNDFIDVVCAGFGGDSVLISNTILTLKAIVAHFTGSLTVSTLQFLLDQILAFLVGKNRSEVESAVVFLITFIKVLPAPLVANHLTTIVSLI